MMKSHPLFLMLLSLLAFVACGDQTPMTEKVGQSVTPKVERNARILRLITYEEYIAESILEKFTEETGISIDYVACENTVEMRAQLQSTAGVTDIVIADDVSTDEFAQLELIQPLDKTQIIGLENLDQSFLNQDFDPQNTYSIPYLWGTTLIAYRTDWNPNPKKSWSTVIDPTSDARIGWLNEANDIFALSLLASGHPIATTDKAHFEDATELMSKFVKTKKPTVAGLYEVLDLLDAGDLDAIVTYSGDAALYAEENEKIDYFIPDEGAAIWLDSFAIVKNAPNVSGAHKFISFLLRPEIAAENAEALWYATPNQAALAHLDEEFLQDDGLWPKGETRERLSFFKKSTQERDVMVSQGMRIVMDAIRKQKSNEAVVAVPDEENSE